MGRKDGQAGWPERIDRKEDRNDCHRGLPARSDNTSFQKGLPERLPDRTARKICQKKDCQKGLPDGIAQKGLPERVARKMARKDGQKLGARSNFRGSAGWLLAAYHCVFSEELRDSNALPVPWQKAPLRGGWGRFWVWAGTDFGSSHFSKMVQNFLRNFSISEAEIGPQNWGRNRSQAALL